MNRLTALNRIVLLCVIAAMPLLAQQGPGPQGAVDADWPNHQVYYLIEPRGTYVLDFDKTYETVASLDVETMVSLPKGYTFSLNRPGSIDFINAFVMQNTLFFTRTIDHAIATSIVCNVITPEGETKNLIFKIRGGVKGDPVVYAIHFTVLEKKQEAVAVEEKSCDAEVEAAVAANTKELNKSVYENTMVEALPAFFNHRRGSMRIEYKGATVFINGVIFTRGEAYVYLYANVKKDMCDIVKLLKITQGQADLPADHVSTTENMDGTWAYVYKVPLQMPERNKRSRIQFVFEIWSKVLSYTAYIS